MSDNGYFISGDRTGITYGIYKGEIFNKPELIKSGIKSFKAASKIIDELKEQDKKSK